MSFQFKDLLASRDAAIAHAKECRIAAIHSMMKAKTDEAMAETAEIAERKAQEAIRDRIADYGQYMIQDDSGSWTVYCKADTELGYQSYHPIVDEEPPAISKPRIIGKED